MNIVVPLFVLLVVYQLKHFLADYILQGEYMLGKFKPGWAFLMPLLAHVAVHSHFTFWIAFASLAGFMGIDFWTALNWATWIGLLDGFVHFYMDRLKASPKYMGRWKPVTAAEYMDCKSTIEHTGTWYDAQHEVVVHAKARLRGNKLFWWALGFDQMVHHLTHYACIYFILHLAGRL